MEWLGQSGNRRVLAAIMTIGGLAMFVKFLALGKEMLVARSFGASNELDAFYVAWLLPNFLGAVAGDSFESAFMPTYVEVQRTGHRTAQRLLSSVTVLNFALLAAVSLLLLLSQVWLLPVIGSGLEPAKIVLARQLLFILVVQLCVIGLISTWRTVLNAHEQFAFTAIAPAMNPLAIALVLVLAGSSFGVYGLAVGTILGATGELVFYGYALRRIGIPLIPRWRGFDAPLRGVLRQYAPMVAGCLLVCSTTVVDQAMAAMLGAGSVSALNYATKLIAVPLSIGAYSLSTAMLPNFSRLSADQDWSGMRDTLASYTRLIVLLALPLVCFFIYFSEPLVTLLLRRGAFTQQNAHLVARVQTLLCLQLPFSTISILYLKALSSLKCNFLLMWGTAISVAANAGLNLLLMKLIGLPGIALSTSLVQALSCCYLSLVVYHQLRKRELSGQSSYAVASATSVM